MEWCHQKYWLSYLNNRLFVCLFVCFAVQCLQRMYELMYVKYGHAILVFPSYVLLKTKTDLVELQGSTILQLFIYHLLLVI